MRRFIIAAGLLVLLVGCSGSSSGPTQRYYDPQGLFSARLPTDNDVVQLPPQQVEGSPDLLSGVLSVPAEPSPSASPAVGGGGFIQPATQQDTAIYAVFAVKADKDSKLADQARTLLGQTLGPELVSQRPIKMAGGDGVLAVVDHHDDEGPNDYTDASAFVLDGQVLFWVRELFAVGEWDKRRDSFLEVVRSFQPGVPAGAAALPLTRPGLQVRSAIGWPLG